MQIRWIFLSLILLIISCSKPRFFNKYKALNNNKWAINKPVDFSVDIKDSLAAYNIFINIRNNNQYSYSNLFLVVSTYFNNTISEIDTLEYEMANASGKWLGTGFTDVKENKLIFKINYKFPKTGNYRYSIVHADRKNGNLKGDKFLKGITDVGMSIEYYK